ncbi:MAG: hypothetical protein ACREOL_02785 [Candidatus Dormibacteria bacterium]
MAELKAPFTALLMTDPDPLTNLWGYLVLYAPEVGGRIIPHNNSRLFYGPTAFDYLPVSLLPLGLVRQSVVRRPRVRTGP